MVSFANGFEAFDCNPTFVHSRSMGLFEELCSLCQLVNEEFDAGFPVVAYAVVLALDSPDVVLLVFNGDSEILLA